MVFIVISRYKVIGYNRLVYIEIGIFLLKIKAEKLRDKEDKNVEKREKKRER